MKIIETKISELKLAKYNPRIMSDKELNNLKKSLKKFGFIQSVVANKNSTVIGGHQRIRAWKEMGNDSVPTVFVDVTPKEEKALNLSLNRIGGEWDAEKLFDVITEIKADEELEYTGFDEKEISRILDVHIEDEDEEKPLEELLEIAPKRAKAGEIWQLGEHKVMCADSTNQEDVDKLLGEKKADMVFTDPPYNVDYEATSLGKIKNDKMSDNKFADFMGKIFAVMHKSCKDGAVIYICSGWQSFSTFLQTLRENNFHISETIIWVKNLAGIRTLEFPHKHEQVIKAKRISKKKKKGKAIIYGWKKGKHKYYKAKLVV